ncbi:MAG TPA: Crp/Fnr family transcriptional regulator [Pyrinomonadaceae bacterium]
METFSPIRPVSKPPTRFTGLLTNKLLTSLPGPDFAALLPHLVPATLNSGDELYAFGNNIETIYFPETAVLSQVSYLTDGSATEVAVVGNEGVVGLSALFGSQPSMYWTKVTIAGTALRASIHSLSDEFRRGKSFQERVLAYTSSFLNQVSQRVVCNSRHRLEERLCTWLLLLHDRAQGAPLTLTHEQIAERLGARRAGITSFCSLLREKQAIAYQRGVISAVNRDLLEEWACECYDAISHPGRKRN